MNRYIQPTNPTAYTHEQHAQAHQHQANLHHYHATAHIQQAQAHQQVAHALRQNAPMNLATVPTSIYNYQPTYGYGPSTSYVTTPHHDYATHTNKTPDYTNQTPSFSNQAGYTEKQTAYAGQVSPAALVFQGHVAPEALASLHEYNNPYSTHTPYQNTNLHLSTHAAHATENQAAIQRSYRF